MLIKRTQILLEQTDWQQLSKLAKRKNLSVGAITRDAIRRYMESETSIRASEAIDNIISIRPKAVKGKINYAELINHGRKH